jgi:hypothetical protein
MGATGCVRFKGGGFRGEGQGVAAVRKDVACCCPQWLLSSQAYISPRIEYIFAHAKLVNLPMICAYALTIDVDRAVLHFPVTVQPQRHGAQW